jgi:hypothetical protein
MKTRKDKLALAARERRAAVELTLLNHALRHDKGPVDRLITKVVMTQIPETPDEQTGGGPGQRGRLDAPAAAKPPRA